MSTSGWAIDGPVKTPVAEARRLVFSATGGAEGFADASSMLVTPMAPTGAGVQVLPGSALILSRYADEETYQVSVNTAVVAEITPTGSSARSDMVAFLVKDPWAPNSAWDEPAEAELETYDFFGIHVFQGVPATATTVADIPGLEEKYKTALALARVDLPASTGAVSAGMIKRLGTVARPQRLEDIAFTPVAETQWQDLVSATWVNWPYATQTPVKVPKWATHCIIDAEIVGYQVRTAATAGNLRMRLDDGGTVNVSDGPTVYYNEQTVTASGNRESWPVGGKQTVPAALRGKNGFIRMRGIRSSGASGSLWAPTSGLMRVRVLWLQEA